MEIFKETDNTTKNIVIEILAESFKRKLETNEGFCTHYVKLLMLDPEWGVSPELKINRNKIQALVSWIIEKLSDVEGLSLTTIMMQEYYMSKYTTREELIQNHYNLINSIIKPLLEYIIGEKIQHNKSRILKRMTLYIILVSKLGDIKDNMVFRETFQALKSIIDEDDLNDFEKMNEEEKRIEMIYKQKIVMGIRLFNSDSGRQTAAIANLPKIIQQSASVMQIDFQKELCYIMDIVNLTTTAIESVFIYNSPESDNALLDDDDMLNFKANLKLPEGTSYEDLEKILDILVIARQYEVYLRKFLLDLKVIHKNIDILVENLRSVLYKLHNTVKYKIAVVAATVFPLFMDLGEIWICIQEESIIFSHLIEVFKHLQSLTTKVKIDKEKLYLMIGDNRIMTDAMRLEKTTGIRIGPLLSADCQILDPLEIEDFENLHLEFLGFCIWKFILTNGALIPGNPNMGVLKWDDKYYVFSIPQAAVYFAQDPHEMLVNALSIARKKPELISLLQIQQQIYSIRHFDFPKMRKELYKDEKKFLHKRIQTEIHPIETYIDKKYEWNTWKMLKDSVFLADVTKRRTHPSQTKLSHLRCNTAVQTTLQRHKNEQTKKDNYTTTPTIAQYQFGLRGRKDNNIHRIDMTRPIEEDLFLTCATANLIPFGGIKREFKASKKNKMKKERQSAPVTQNENNKCRSLTCKKKYFPALATHIYPKDSNICSCEFNLSGIPETEYHSA